MRLTPFSYDGHGINDARGERLFTCARLGEREGSGYALLFNERAEIGELFAAAPDLLELAERLTATLDNVLLHLGQHMTPADYAGRWGTVAEAEALVRRLRAAT